MAQPTTGDSIAPAHAHDGEEFVVPPDPDPIEVPDDEVEAIEGGAGLDPAIDNGENTKEALDARADLIREEIGEAIGTEVPGDA
jgi:hypothetical protein